MMSDSLRIAGIKKQKVFIGPKIVNIHLNNNCNLNCIFCWYHSRLVKKRPEKKCIEFRYVKRFVRDCKDIGVEIISLEGDGETFLYPEIKELIELIKGYGIRVEIYTNGTFDKSMIKSLIGTYNLKVNLSAATPETYAKVQCIGKLEMFYRVIGNIRIIKRVNKMPMPAITITYIINDLNFHEIQGMVRLSKKLGIDRIRFKIIEATEETKGLVISDANKKKFLKCIEDAIRASEELRVKTNLKEIKGIANLLSFKKNIYSIERSKMHSDRHFYFEKDLPGSCYVGWFYSFIDIDGNVVAPCDSVGVSIVGNIKKRRFKNIWFSQKFGELRKEASCFFDSKKEKWQECRYCHCTDFNRNMERKVGGKDA